MTAKHSDSRLHFLRRLHSEERGVVAIIFAFVLIPLIGMLALTVDLGFGYGQRRMAQNVADSGAVAATKVVAANIAIPGSQRDAGVWQLRSHHRLQVRGDLTRSGAASSSTAAQTHPIRPDMSKIPTTRETGDTAVFRPWGARTSRGTDPGTTTRPSPLRS